MTKTKASIEKPAKSAEFVPPRWMTRSEKADFRRLVMARNDVGKPVLNTELDLLSDYVSGRSRLALLRRMAKSAAQKCRDPFDTHGLNPFGNEPAQRHALLLMRQCEAAAASSRRLARDLKLIGIE